MIVVGMISGTSADGIDAAVVEINGAPPALEWRLIKHRHASFPTALRAEILACFDPAHGSVDRICALNFALGEEFARVALEAIQAAGLDPAQVDLLSSHGQTLWHIPSGPTASTLQLGEPAIIAERTGITTVSNLRTRDMAAGGQGAPLVPHLDVLLFAHPTLTRAAQNIGGIGNVTYLPPQPGEGRLRAALAAFAFDTGPGNMLIDFAAQTATNGALTFDRDGALAAKGRPDEKILAELMQEPYLKLAPPKTTGRELFGAQFGKPIWDRAKASGLGDNDIIATFTAFTARSISQSYRDFLPTPVDEVIVSGGGALNPTLMQMLRDQLAPARVVTVDEMGLASEAKEAVAFAVMGYETIHQRASNLPAATGATHPVILGNITPGAATIPNAQIPSSNLTEASNPATVDIDALSTLDMLRRINGEDARVAMAVEDELPRISKIVDTVAARMRNGGRLVYVGAGTSGRLGVLDAAEMPPTFSTPPAQVVGVIAGGERAITQAVEGAEDDQNAGARDIRKLEVSEHDSVIGISASGRAPYVLGAMREARARGAFVASIACNRPSPAEEIAEESVALLVGPEVISGSTRMKAGTAQKMALNLISTGVMIRLGKTYGNLMVDLKASNSKLRDRARRIVASAANISGENAAELLERCNGEVKTAIVAARRGVSAEQARKELERAHGSVRNALGRVDH